MITGVSGAGPRVTPGVGYGYFVGAGLSYTTSGVSPDIRAMSGYVKKMLGIGR